MAIAAERALLEILERAIEGHAEEVSLQYEQGGTEVCYLRDGCGVGSLVPERGLITHVVSRARLGARERGTLRLPVGGRLHTILVEAYENFGETALRLRFGEAGAGGGAVPRKRGKRNQTRRQ